MQKLGSNKRDQKRVRKHTEDIGAQMKTPLPLNKAKSESKVRLTISHMYHYNSGIGTVIDLILNVSTNLSLNSNFLQT